MTAILDRHETRVLAKVIRFLFLICAPSTLTGCYYLPTLNATVLPRADLRHIRVVDADTGKAIPGTAIVLQVFTASVRTTTNLDRGGSLPDFSDPDGGGPTPIPYDAPDEKVAYRDMGGGNFACNGEIYSGWGYFAGFLQFWSMTQKYHYAFAVVSALGYQTLAIATYGRGQLEGQLEIGSSARSAADDSAFRPRHWPEMQDGTVIVKMDRP